LGSIAESKNLEYLRENAGYSPRVGRIMLSFLEHAPKRMDSDFSIFADFGPKIDTKGMARRCNALIVPEQLRWC
jgi:hypothetical protein